MSGLVLDASVALAWFFEDQSTPFTDKVLDLLLTGSDDAATCAIWPFEIANTLAVAERRKATSAARISEFVQDLSEMRILVDLQGFTRTMSETLQLARKYRLSAYDAGYLDLAMREGTPLATIDKALRSAAHAAGVEQFE